MIKEMKKKILRKTIVVAILLVLAGGVLVGLMANGAMPFLASKTDIYDASIKKIKNTTYAEVEIDKYNLYGCFGSESGESKAYYCALLVGDEDDARLMAVKVDAKYEDELDKIEQEYTDLDNGIDSDERTVIKVKGKLEKMTGSKYSYFKDFIMDYGYTESEVPFVSLNLCLTKGEFNMEVICFFIGILLIISAIVVVIYVLATGCLGKLRKQLKNMSEAEQQIMDNDYLNAAKVGKNIRIGREYTFMINTIGVVVIANKDLVWAYPNKVQHRTNGIPTGTTYSVMLYDINKKNYALSADDEDMCQAIMGVYASISDKILLGYDDSYMNMFRSDFNRFLSLAYNRQDIADRPLGDLNMEKF